MPLGLLRYGLSRDYPARGDIPDTPALKPAYDVVIVGWGAPRLDDAPPM